MEVRWDVLDDHRVLKTRCEGKGGEEGHCRHVPHYLLWVQGHWHVQHLPVQVHGDTLDGHRVLKLGV